MDTFELFTLLETLVIVTPFYQVSFYEFYDFMRILKKKLFVFERYELHTTTMWKVCNKVWVIIAGWTGLNFTLMVAIVNCDTF